jgi:subtilisin family serine protease
MASRGDPRRGASSRSRARGDRRPAPEEGTSRLRTRIALAALAVVLVAAAGGRVERPRSAPILAPPADADVLLALPIAGIEPARLAAALELLGHHTLPTHPLHGAVRVVVPPGEEPAAIARALATSGLVRAVEADGLVHATRVPGDPLYVELQSSYLDAVRAPEAWERTRGDREVVIAVIDTGIDLTHPDMQRALWVNAGEIFGNERDDDGNGCIDDAFGCSFVSLATADPSCGYRLAPPNGLVSDDEGHGTFVASIAAASGDDGRGITGVTWAARLLPVKVLDCTATGRISDAAAGIRYAARQGADIINISFGSPSDSRLLHEAISEAEAAGALVVASAGNEGPGGATFPARYDSVLSVTASGVRGAAADGSVDYERGAHFASTGDGVDLFAPGLDVAGAVPVALCNRGLWLCRSEEPYAVAAGSSYAAPLAAGAAALVLAERPGLAPALVRALILGSARRGAGGEPLLDVAAALEAELFGIGVPGTARPGGPPGRPAAP